MPARTSAHTPTSLTRRPSSTHARPAPHRAPPSSAPLAPRRASPAPFRSPHAPAPLSRTQTMAEASGDTAAPAQLLSHRIDSYSAVHIHADDLPDAPEEFATRLDASLAAWREAGCRGIWLSLPTARAALAGPAAARGFDFHFAEPGRLVMSTWLPEGDSRLPRGPSSHVGIGACVCDRKGRVLVVKEKRWKDMEWKLVTGRVDPGEDVTAGAEREVLEETGVVARSTCLLYMRQGHGLLLGASECYFMVGLVVEDAASQALRSQEEEIHDCTWVDAEEWAARPGRRHRPIVAHMSDCVVAFARAVREGREAGVGLATTGLLAVSKPGDELVAHLPDVPKPDVDGPVADKWV
ncbi:unnamed protein product [Pedinophyceae sp. YPF-701]|nr:unnamed protein product [Pedinophyceae sp. YPF-701]